MKNRIIVLVFLIGAFLFAANISEYKIAFLFSENTVEEKGVLVSDSTVIQKNENKTTKLFAADIKEGIIGVDNPEDIDDAYDNVFHLKVDELPAQNENAYLEYELFGYDQAASISRSLNNQPSIGGQFLSYNKAWTSQSELLSEKSLRKGDNVLLFTAPEGTANGYKIKNVRIVYKNGNQNSNFTLLKAADKLYIKGTNFPSQLKKMTIAGISVDVTQPEFELVLDAEKIGESVSVLKETASGVILNEEIKVKQFSNVESFRPIESAKERVSKIINFETANALEYKDFLAVFPAGALKNNVKVSVSGLRKIDIAPLNSAMVNVTAVNAGFRLLPHGTIFEKAVTLSLPYDKKTIPEGYTEKDINVFYFDENKRLWQEVTKDSLDIKQGIIKAKTTHFTDFIAGIIKMPESPETSGYTPTSIKDLKAASPLVGIQSIAPPSANGRGTMSTGFSIVIPNGRGGMQPSFNLQYDSDGGHSWAGMGWDISAPAVSIETRWGAPRYDAVNETESYAVAGEALIPNSHRAEWIARTADKQFYPRREGAFQQIIRKGSSPKNYYWVVKDKSGVASYYGGTQSGLAVNSVLQDANGNIGHWALCLQVDLKGNTVEYEYDKRDGELYLKKVYYTGSGSQKGNYSVTFVKNSDLGEANRTDVQVSARLGFKQLNNQLLRKIEVRYKNDLVRSYELKFKEGAFKKTLLESISENDSESKLFYTNKLDYFDDVRDTSGKYSPFGAEQVWNVPNDNLKNSSIPVFSDALFSGKHSLVSSSEGATNGVSYRLGIGLATNAGSLKGFTVGGHGGNSWGSSDTAVSLEDLDGDGLPDKVFKNKNGVYYRKNLAGSGQLGFGELQEINISDVGFSKSTSFNWGVDLNLKYGNIGYDQQRSTNKTKAYFMDFNGDGLVDFVKNGQVYYNRLENGVPTFRSSSTGTPSPVFGGGDITIPGFTTISADEIEKQNPLHDVVRMWEAPVKGIVSVSHQYQLIEDTTPDGIKARAAYVNNAGNDKADGVHLYFQKGNQLLWNEAIGPKDYAIRTKQNIGIAVERGERLYFRVSSVKDGNFDAVNWNPVVTYSQVKHFDRGLSGNVMESDFIIPATLKDVNGYSLASYNANADFFSSSVAGKTVAAAGNVVLKGILNKPVTSDHIKLVITKTYLEQTNPAVVVFEKTFLANEVASFNLASVNLPAFEAETQISLALQTETNINWQTISFAPTVTVPAYAGGVAEEVPMDVSHTLYNKREGNYNIPGITSTVSGKVKLSILPQDLVLATPFQYPGNINNYNGDVIISAKQNNVLLARNRYRITAGAMVLANNTFDDAVNYPDAVLGTPIQLEMTVSNAQSMTIIKNYPKANALNVQVQIIDFKDVADLTDDIVLNTTTDDFVIYSLLNADERTFGLYHRQWGGFMINGNLASNTIDQNQLKQSDAYNTEPDLNNTDPDNYDGKGYEIADSYFVSLNPSYSKYKWEGLEEGIYIKGQTIGTSRLGEDDIADYTDFTLPNLQGGSTSALDMISESKSKSISGGVSAGGSASFGYSKSIDGDSYMTQTMSDFNGDRFPDYIRGGNIQLTAPVGKVSDQIVNIGDNFSHSRTSSEGPNFGGSYSHGAPSNSMSVTVAKSKVKGDSAKETASKEAEKGGNSISVSASQGKGEDRSVLIHSDINGDGLPDKITESGDVFLNTGYGFLPAEKWNLASINKGNSTDWSAGLGFSIKQGSISGGANYARSQSDSDESFMDINGDGLADKIRYVGSTMLVSLNLGNSFDMPVVYPRFPEMSQNKGVSYGLNANVSIDIIAWLLRITPTIGGSKGWSTNRSEGTFMDIDGDGNLDYVVSKDDGHLTAQLSNIKRTNKLKSVKNGAGNSYTVDYELLKPSYENPSAKWVLQTVDVFDGHTGDGIDHSIAKFRYEDGYQDRREREFYGFGKVTQEQIDAADNSVFMTTVQEFYNQDYFRKNLLKYSYTLDKNGKMRQESENEYSFIDVATQASVPISELNLPSCDAKRIFVGLIHANQKVYEGGSDYLETNTFNTYDANGNIIQYEDLGNGAAADKVTAKISYYESTTPYYGGIPKQLEVFTADGLRRKRATTINTTTAEVTQIKNYASADKIAVTDIEYDGYGNLQKITGPSNHKDQRMTLEYVYDAENHQYMTEIKDAFGYQNKMEYNYRFGVPVKTTDRNDQSTDYTLDAKGRIATIRAPYEIASGKSYTIAYEYFPDAKVPYAKTRNYDPELDKDIETYTYTDGLGRALQVKKTASLFTQAGSADQEAHIISGKVIYDGLGRAITSYYPTTSTTLDNNFSTAVSTVAPTKTDYDEVNRPIKVTLPDGSSNTTVFALESYDGLPVLKTTQTDALNKTNTTYTDATGQNVASMQNDLTTKFDTNALGEMVKVTDAMDHITKSTYDWLGRRIEFTHPDAGTTKMEYDLAGNLTTRITQDIKNTVPNGGAIQYVYNYNRLESIKYPKNPQNNVQYNYGKADGTPSRRGRLWFVQDASGGQEFFYGKLGEVEKEIRTLRITPTDIQTYILQYEYDTWNRIQKMTYPDGEVVEYTYNRAGNLQSMQGKKESHTYDYIKQLSYDEFEQRKYLKYGNNTETNYTYDPVMRRLQQLQVKSGSRQVMNNAYGYDLVGNVLSIKNTAPIVNNALGGTSAHEYQYDDFYRLKSAKAAYQGEFTKASYELNMSYNKMHNITKKDLVHIVNNEQKGYVLDYNYDNELHPNAPNKIAEAGKVQPREYVYDGNGNPTSYTEEKNFRKMTWDEENRLMGINDNGRVHQYTYDAGGERVIKSSGDSQNVAINGETAATIVHTDDYTGNVSPYFVISKGKFTKHYFEGAGRIVSKLGNGAFAQPLKLTAGGVNYGKLTAEQQKALDTYVRSLGLPPGPPTQQGIYATPEFTGDPYPSEVLKPVEENQEPPAGWPRNPVFNAPGDVPGPPVQFGPPIEPETVKSGEGFTGTGMPENDIFYFHPDHLGSTSYITTKNGSISQHVEYIAFGEVLFEEHSSTFSSPYLFNGKELDRETNLSYYGARYYDAKTSLWLSGDPLAEKYPNVGAYVYCLNNPIVFVDPDGKDPITGIIDAVSSFALDVGMDYFGGMLIEGKSSQEAYNDIGWASATWGAVGSYAISSVTPTGTATAIKIQKFAKSRAGKMIIGTVTKMTTKIIDNYSKGKYDTDGHFDMDKLMEGEDGLMNIFLESSIETLVEQGFGNKAEEMLGSLKIENKALIRKVNKMLNKVENGESPTRIKNYFKKVKEQGNKALKGTNNLLRQKTKDAVQKGAISKKANQYRKDKQKENDK
ncbi:SpvB/TcaC N-terminal domain-containing protein [Flavobacterium sp. LHD-80]|uniref:SpvB/TcaC N-terminal domain-containing protein n=1 Tax=Flavobacterium sp. LHD-80 TaxID=3071411 RepID=UPI0027DF859C|nr:SpvB/TcaC N-terminal domain-containing protein [Flavobacterium sp. LHD-80]MDQ6469892.1 SpvB/TcaC N-terminal domain-containing protein [Flavobacterium sp. LHD-80]